MIQITYIGSRPEHKDSMYGTNAIFKKGETKLIPDDTAKKMLRHSDVYALGEESKLSKLDKVEHQEKTEEYDFDKIMAEKDLVNVMNLSQLEAYAEAHYQLVYPAKTKASTIKNDIISKLDTLGLN
jgi:hypothetical protein